jgi:hypothetical protein
VLECHGMFGWKIRLAGCARQLHARLLPGCRSRVSTPDSDPRQTYLWHSSAWAPALALVSFRRMTAPASALLDPNPSTMAPVKFGYFGLVLLTQPSATEWARQSRHPSHRSSTTRATKTALAKHTMILSLLGRETWITAPARTCPWSPAPKSQLVATVATMRQITRLSCVRYHRRLP